MDRRFTVDGNELAAHLARPSRLHPQAQPGVVIAHGFPAEAGGGANSTKSFPELADRIATDLGWVALVREVAGGRDRQPSRNEFVMLAGQEQDRRGLRQALHQLPGA